jgi:lysophospholipase L1-like esterase
MRTPPVRATAAADEPGTRRRSRLVVASFVAIAALALGSAVAGPAYAASASVSTAKGGGKPGGGGGGTTQLAYAALGDSYAAGQGARPYLEQSCYTSSKSYAKLLDADANLQLVAFPACTGASTTEVTNQQVPTIPNGVTRVTVTVGGNDTGFATVMQNCFVIVVSSCANDIAAGTAVAESQGFKDSIAAVITAIRSKAPTARIILTGYPLLFNEPNTKYQWADEVNAATPKLNTAIRAAAESNGAVYVDVVETFRGHGIGSPSPWINDWSWLYYSVGFHPNATGYGAYATEVRKVIG